MLRTLGRLKVLERAFTRVELLATSAALLLVGAVITSAIGASKMDSGREVCFNNLRLVGRAVQTWAADHGQQFPWRTLGWQVIGGEGTLPAPGNAKPGNAWYEYAVFSNELVTPKTLACPSDASAKQAINFTSDPTGGFFSPPYRNNAVSYPLHLDGSMDLPQSWLSADRNFRAVPGFPGVCSARIPNGTTIDTAIPPASSSAGWTNGVVHGVFGHVLATDGSVEFTSTERLREFLFLREGDDNGLRHFLPVR